MSVKNKFQGLCLYHDDADGRCCAAIVRRALGKKVILLSMDYGDPVPWETVEKVHQVIIVDFSLPQKTMEKIHNTTALVWIDHHKTSLDDLKDLAELPGMRDLDQAACVLTWKFFFPDQPIPKAVSYIGDQDIWRHEFPQTKVFNEGLYFEDSRPFNDPLWERLLGDEPEFVSGIIERGEVLFHARMISIERMIPRQGFDVKFNGYRTLAINGHASGELGEAIRRKGYDIAYCYSEARQNGLLMTSVTLYSSQVDVAEIAKKYGGGGHPGAAGFSFQRSDSPFPKESIE